MSEDYNDLTEEERKRLNVPAITAKINVIGKEEINRLTDENERLTQQLQAIAEKEFEIAKQKHGAPEEIETPEELEAWIAGKKSNQPKATGKAPLFNEPSYRATHSNLETDSEGNVIVPNDWLDKEYVSEGEMVATLRAVEKDEKRKDTERQQATKILNELTKKALTEVTKSGESMTFHGSFKDLAAGKSDITDWKKTKKEDLKEE